jgi:translation initiation factor 2A
MATTNPAARSTEVLPELQLILQQKESVKIFSASSTSSAPVSNPTYWESPCSTTKDYGGLSIPPTFSPAGNYVCIVATGAAGIRVLNSGTNELVRELSCPDVMSMDFSPLGSFLVTWSRPTAASGPSGNLRVWDMRTGEVVIQFVQKVQKKNLIQWTHDEHVCMRIVSNEIHILDGHAPASGIKCKLFIKNVALYSIAGCGTYCDVVCFIPSQSGNPSHIALYRVENSDLAAGAKDSDISTWWPEGCAADAVRPSTVPLVSRSSMFNASDATLQWNAPLNNVCLIQVTSDVDSSGSSYYGNTGAYLLACPPPARAGAAKASATTTAAELAATVTENIALQVPQSKSGPIYMISWSPTGLYFVLVGGNMPSNSTLYNMKGGALYEFGTFHRNTVIWSPHGRFFVIAGLGNCSGDVDFYELQVDAKSNKEKIKRLGQANAHCSVQVGWSPDSRYFMAATLAPRMNVDNGFKIFKYNGAEVYRYECNSTEFKTAYHCTWRPAAKGVYPNRSRSPQAAGGAEAAPPAPKPEVAAKPAPYRPPRSTGSLSNLLNRDSAPPTAAGKIVATPAAVFKPAPYKPPVRAIPGMAAPKPAPVPAAKPKAKAAKSAAAPAPAKAADPMPPPPPADSAEEKEKRAKNLKKKLRQIEELEQKARSGAELTDEQKQKLDTRASVEEELAKLAL